MQLLLTVSFNKKKLAVVIFLSNVVLTNNSISWPRKFTSSCKSHVNVIISYLHTLNIFQIVIICQIFRAGKVKTSAAHQNKYGINPYGAKISERGLDIAFPLENSQN